MIDFISSISTPTYSLGVRYIIIGVEYITQWVEVEVAKYCIALTKTKFIYKNIITKFICPKEIIHNQGKYFINHIISKSLTNFMIQHNQSSSYHPQENGAIKAINKILDRTLEKLVSVRWLDWEEKLTCVL